MIFASWGLLPKMINPAIGLRHLSDHTPVTLIWRLKQKGKTVWNWRLNNYIMEAPGVRMKIESEVMEYFCSKYRIVNNSDNLGYI